ncbi:PorT family protein [Segetibacter sp. 3557_3]|uniref:porin family protein n=1 Tax=Segetibacter sp. 3557_3 TaxID=2547429 RepID=UPI001058EFDA|nr:porin family protein [Segetibacter sp. 3557_3]TDH20849.1 PorT family protein [Segetibacter sp. 3557_3]
MKKLILLLFVLVALEAAAQAPFTRNFKYGVKLGASGSNMNFNKGEPRPASHIASAWKTGVIAGVFLDIPLSPQLALQPEYSYVQMSGELAGTDRSFKTNYLSLPVLLKYRPAKPLSVFIGPEFDLLLNAKGTTIAGEANITHDTEERNFAAIGGFEYNIYKSLSLDFRYIHGLNHVGIGQRSNTIEFKYELIQVTGTFRF